MVTLGYLTRVLLGLAFVVSNKAMSSSSEVIQIEHRTMMITLKAGALPIDALMILSSSDGSRVTFHRPFLREIIPGAGYDPINLQIFGDTWDARGLCRAIGSEYFGSSLGNAHVAAEFPELAVRLDANGDFKGVHQFSEPSEYIYLEAVTCRLSQ